ncbi:MAG: HEAT repeat domain-containing protein [Verrucomicrobia bacterium]|nr:HEAT repeat domain-containing protein [Verrucomicrobiota bacterium]
MKSMLVFGSLVIMQLCPVWGQSTKAADSGWNGTIAERREAITAAAHSGRADTSMVQSLIEAMACTANELQPDAAVEGLPKWHLPGPDPMAEMRTAMGERPVLVGCCCEALLFIGGSAFEHVVRGLDHENRWVRFGCAWVLGRMKNAEAVVPLSRLLDRASEDRNVRVEVARSLELLNDPRSAKHADTALRSIPMNSAEKSAMVSLLVQVDKNLATKWICDLGSKGQATEHRTLAARYGGRLTDLTSGELLRGLLKDRETMVRLEAARSLGTRLDQSAEQLLLALAKKSSENAGVRTQAAWALARLGNPAGKEILERISAHGPDFAKGQAEESLTALKEGKETNSREPQEAKDRFEAVYVDMGGGVYCRID